MARGETLINAIVGAVASIVLSFVPFSPVLGGALAGYFQGGDRNEGLTVGAIAGLIAAIPLTVAILAFGSFFTFLPFLGAEGILVGGIGLFVLIVGLAFSLAYGVLLSAVGGLVGNYVLTDTDIGKSGGSGNRPPGGESNDRPPGGSPGP